MVAAGNTKRRHGRREMPPRAAKSTRSVLPRMGQRLFCPTFCALQKVEKSCRRAAQRPRSGKGFNYVRAKPPLRRAESRFAEPRDFPERVRFYSFRLYEKNQKYPRGLRTSGLRGTIQISARYMAFAEVTGHHHVTGDAGYCKLPGYRR